MSKDVIEQCMKVLENHVYKLDDIISNHSDRYIKAHAQTERSNTIDVIGQLHRLKSKV